MAFQAYTVAVPATATSLASLLQALSTWPTQTVANVTTKMSVGPVAELDLQSAPANAAGLILIGGPNLSLTAGRADSLAPGASVKFGSASQSALSLAGIYVMTTGAAGDLLSIGIIG
jgi:hypothetical protein